MVDRGMSLKGIQRLIEAPTMAMAAEGRSRGR
jgi:hypothetical protein